MSETWDEQLDRVEMMAAGDPSWDLSDNDMDALKAVLKNRADVRAMLERLEWEGNAMGIICPECRKYENHTPDCELARLLGRVTK